MARLHEYQGKSLLAQAGIAVPRGAVADSAAAAGAAALALSGKTVVKIQAWTTGRAAMGGIAFADTPEQAAQAAERMLKMRVGNFPIDAVLVEERLSFVRELFLSFSVDDRTRAPVMLLAAAGGSGIEDRAAQVARIPCLVSSGPNAAALAAAVASAGLTGTEAEAVA
ncbi:MAG: hypothetical protein EXS00_07610, partial [Phycisphaerales bacterium]|nr:hypothetical protein [Phycisphaerales bacterium]